MLIRGLRSSQRPGKLQGGGSQSYTAAELISQQPPPHEEEGERPSELGGREKAVTVLSSFWYKRLPEPTILLQ